MAEPVGTVFKDVPIELVSSTEEARAVLAKLQVADMVACDTETVFREALTEDNIPGALRVISIAARLGDYVKAFVFDCRDIDVTQLRAEFRKLLLHGWNANFDDHVFRRSGIGLTYWWDGMFAEALLRQGQRSIHTWYKSLAFAARSILDVDVEGKGTVQLSYDATSDLSADQVDYAGYDAIVTMYVCEELRRRMATIDTSEPHANLHRTMFYESGGRAFINQIMIEGIPFDQEGWELELEQRIQRRSELMRKLAELTGGGQTTMFDADGNFTFDNGVEQPNWNPNSDKDLKQVLNEFAIDNVHQYLGEKRPLASTDSVNKAALSKIDHPITKTLLELRKHEKVLSTYGDNLFQYVRDGRIRSRYKQALIDTGRLGSFAPNAQNFSPLLKPFFHPEEGSGRIFVYGDLSQAELRYLAQVSGDVALRQAFADGVDIHVRTAELMLDVNMAKMKVDDPDAFKRYRQIGKTLNFAVIYGLGASALADQLTESGVATTEAEAKNLLKAYRKAYPQVAVWVEERDKVVKAFADNHPPVDWDTTFELYEIRKECDALYRGFRKEHKGRHPDEYELSELARPETRIREELEARGEVADQAAIDAERARFAARVKWAYAYEAATVLCTDGTPLTFCSYTSVGRRRQFQVSLEASGGGKAKWVGVFVEAMLAVAGSDQAKSVAVCDSFSAETGMELRKDDGSPKSREQLAKMFEEAWSKYRFIQHIRDHWSDQDFDRLMDHALRGQIRKLGNAYRNAPIQGGVADGVLYGYMRLGWAVEPVGNVVGIQTVHDSVIVECDEADAPEVARRLKWALESAFAELCPDVPARADTDIRTTLSDDDASDEVEPQDVSDLEEQWAAFVANHPKVFEDHADMALAAA